jgi:hypothetical protein
MYPSAEAYIHSFHAKVRQSSQDMVRVGWNVTRGS